MRQRRPAAGEGVTDSADRRGEDYRCYAIEVAPHTLRGGKSEPRL